MRNDIPCTSSPPVRSREEVERLVKENQRLIWWTINKSAHRMRPSDQEEIFCDCLLGLWKAAANWNPARSNFCTYAIICIRSHINRYFKRRKSKKTKAEDSVLSLDYPLQYDQAGGEVLGDTIPDQQSAFEDRVIARDEIERLLSRCTDRELSNNACLD